MAVKFHYSAPVAIDRTKERIARMTQVVQSFASGFTLRPISVKLTKSGIAPAFSSSDRIWFNEELLGDLTTKAGVASVKGLTLHEISHILLTPRAGSDLRQWVIENKLGQAFNALEDQRIESQLIALYPSIKDWFVAMISEYLLKTPEQWTLSFPLIHGRKYLDKKVRGTIKHVYKYQDKVADLAKVIDEYRTLNLSDATSAERAKELIQLFDQLVTLPQEEDEPNGCGKGLASNPNGHDHRSDEEHETNIKSKPLPKTKQKDASDKVGNEPDEEDDDDLYDDIDPSDFDFDEDEDDDDFDEDEDDDDFDEDEDDQYGSSDSDGDGSSDSDDDEDGSSDSDSEGNSSDSDDEGDATESAPTEGGTAGGVGGSDKPDAVKELEDLLGQALDDSLERLDDKLSNDIDLYNGVALMDGEELPEPPRYGDVQEVPVEPSTSLASESFAQELKRLRAEYDPAWNNRVDSGRINPVRWERGCDLEEAFDRWETGRTDVTDIEAVVLLDVSGSMGGQAERDAHQSMWAIKNALEAVQADVSVLAYCDSWSDKGTYTLYSRDERAGQQVKFISAHGGTNPLGSLQYAKGVLANSPRAIRLLIVITDGAWNSQTLEQSDNLITEMRQGGVLTSLALLSNHNLNVESIQSHGAEVVSHVTKPSDLFYMARSIVEVGVQRQLVR